MQFVWGQVKETFKSICPASLLSYLYFNLNASRFNVNLINKGLTWHHDMVVPYQSDPRRSVPGLTIVVHLGRENDPVNLEFEHDKGKIYTCVSGTMYITPGYALSHRTLRPNPTPNRRYSIAIFMKFKPNCAEEADKYIHGSFEFANDSYVPVLNV